MNLEDLRQQAIIAAIIGTILITLSVLSSFKQSNQRLPLPPDQVEETGKNLPP